jgi:hypothetical protein
MTENVITTEENLSREEAAAKLRDANAQQLRDQQKAKANGAATDAEAARNASVINGVTRPAEEKAEDPKPVRRRTRKPAEPKATAPAKTTTRTTKAKTEAPAKATGRKPKAAPEPAPAAEATSARSTNQDLAKRLIDFVAKEFSDSPEDDQKKIANWLKVLPTGGAGWQRYWPEGFARPTTADWRKP